MVTYSGVVDKVFRAVADPTRRGLLDALFEADGQTLGALESRVDMTRFGVMKHLAVLEEAGLVVARRQGREKLHFLNTVPIRLIHDRWVSKYAEPWASSLSRLKTDLEDATMATTSTVSWQNGTAPVAEGMAVFEVFIKATPERVWEAITDPQQRAKYSFGVQTVSDWAPGSGYSSDIPGVIDIASGTNLEVDPPRLLVQTYNALWSDEVRAQGQTRVTWELEQVGSSCRLTVIHDRLPADANSELYGGWPMILSGLKTLLETGELLDTPGVAPVRPAVTSSPAAERSLDVNGGDRIGPVLRQGLGPQSASTAIAALWPGTPLTPPPRRAPAPQIQTRGWAVSTPQVPTSPADSA